MWAGRGLIPRRLLALYLGLAVLVTAAFAIALTLGSDEKPEPVVAGGYTLRTPDPCLGRSFTLRQSGQFGTLDGDASGAVAIEDGRVTGTIECGSGGEAELDAEAADGRLRGTLGDTTLAGRLDSAAPPPESSADIRPSSIGGEFDLAPASMCLGSAVTLHDGSGDAVSLSGARGVSGELTYADGRVQGSVRCENESRARVTGDAVDRTLQLRVVTAGASPGEPTSVERIEATERRDLDSTLIAFFAAVVVVMAAARLCGTLVARFGQPRVMGEVVAGILLGPTAFGAIAPELQAAVFPSDLIPTLGVVANLGLVFYMFMVGMEADVGQLRNRLTHVAAISNASVAVPLALGVAAAVPTFALLAPDTTFPAFALFLGVAMSITAFPVLARILIERGMLAGRVGATALVAAAIDDITAWFLIALALAVASSGSNGGVLGTIGLSCAFVAVMLLVVRPVLRLVAGTFEERERGDLLALVLGGVLACAFATEEIGISLIFGAFLMGLIMPRGTRLTEASGSRIEAFVQLVLLPLFFAYTGLRTNVGLLDRPELWLIGAGLLAVAIVGKFSGAMVAARITGFDWRGSAVMGTLMNTRGLTELIVLNIALEAGVISQALFAALVLMALITTFMAGPLLRLLDPRNALATEGGAAPGDGVAETPPRPISATAPTA